MDHIIALKRGGAGDPTSMQCQAIASRLYPVLVLASATGWRRGEPRRFVVPDWGLSDLADYRAVQETDRKLFRADYRDRGPISASRTVNTIRRFASAPRQSHACEFHSNLPLPARLGHSDQNITLAIYSHAMLADTRAAETCTRERRTGTFVANTGGTMERGTGVEPV